jgi:hypothetical protein
LGTLSAERPARLGVQVVGLALTLLVLIRLWRLDLVSFVMDEPVLLAAARQQLEGGGWATASPLTGNVGIRYGPTVVWIYGISQWLLGDGVRSAVITMIVLTTATQLAVAAALARLVARPRRAFMIFAGVIASSPYLWFWSRLAWDQTVLIATSAAVAVLAWPVSVSTRRGVAVGVLLGLAMGSHPIAVPFAGAVVVVLGIEWWPSPPRRTHALPAMGVAMAVPLVPYIAHLWQNSPTSSGADANLTDLPVRLGQVGTLLSPARTAYFFDGEWDRFSSSHGHVDLVVAAGGVALVGVLVLAVVGIARSLWDREPRRRRVARLAAISWPACALMASLSGVGLDPHYLWSVWWTIPAGAMLASGNVAADRQRAVRSLTVGIAGLLIAANLVFVTTWVKAIASDQGTRGPHYGVALFAQESLAPSLCALGPNALVVNETEVRPVSLQYLMSTVDGCDWTNVTWFAAECPSSSHTGEVRRLVYADAPHAGLRLVRA